MSKTLKYLKYLNDKQANKKKWSSNNISNKKVKNVN